ncbi:MarR family transcriptional regulator [Microbacterium sp. KUDC0406]|uniref:MarR family winged helix-turn-helix transcriptional regulator n=1 Tax=Microbacterium sp. KUDC0406 TaxID=2909588 RepID=UPI001F233EE5|nr:MarR family transcriptional regulator [Microbacterium sp. KUDC0406]UJP09385.1 MarR family transcriptional regulator [Microbacterium sp. KUDC0406]
MTYWSFVEHFSKVANDRMPWLDVDAAAFFMTLHRAFELIVYDIRGELDQRLTPAGLRVLIVLSSAGQLTLLRVAELTGMSRAAASALLKRLEAEKLVTRTPAENDGRSILIEATTEGKQLMETVYRDYNARESLWFSRLEPGEAEVIKTALSRLASSVSGARRRN